jgi:streptogramin lyase
MNERDLRDKLDEALPLFQAGPDAYQSTIKRARRHRRQRQTTVLLCVIVTTLAAGVAGATFTSSNQSLAAQVTLHLGGEPLASVANGGSIWVLTCDRNCTGTARRSQGRLVRVNAQTAHIVSSVPVNDPTQLAVGERGIWITHFWEGTVTRLSPSTEAAVATIHLRLPKPIVPGDQHFLPGAITAGAGGVWIDTARGYVAHIDPTTNRVARYIPVAADATGPLVTADGNVWIAGSLLGVLRIDPHTGAVSNTPIGTSHRRLAVADLAALGEAVWTIGTVATSTSAGAFTLTLHTAIAEISTSDQHVIKTRPLPHSPAVIYSAEGSLWIGPPPGQPRKGPLVIYRLNPKTGAVAHRYTIHTRGAFVAVQAGAIWLTDPSGTLTRIEYAALNG